MKDIHEWDRFLIPYNQAVEELKIKFKSIRKGYTSVGEYSPIEFVTGRVKKVSSIIEKAKRDNIPLNEIKAKMEDISGIRIICQLVDDIYSVVSFIHDRDGKDFTVLYEKDYIKDYKESGYRSYHIVIKYPLQTAFGNEEILAEIQIRTLAMNFWAIIEHSLNYKYKGELPEKIERRLKNTASVVWKLDTEMLKIKSEIMSSQIRFQKHSILVRNITKKIKVLKSNGYDKKAEYFQKKFDKNVISKDDDELESLSEEITEALRDLI